MKFWSIMGTSQNYTSFDFDDDSVQHVRRCLTCMVQNDPEKYEIISPVRIKITQGSYSLGDFSYCAGMPYPIVREPVKDYIEKCGYPSEFLPAEIVKSPKKFANEKLYLLRCHKAVPLDEKLSTLRYFDCKECGRKTIEYPSIKEGDKPIISAHGERLTIFVLEQFKSAATYMSDDMLQEFRAQGFTHLEDVFLRGEIIE